MANCSAGPARCKIACTGGCACVYMHDIDACSCECFDPEVSNPANLSLSAEVSITVSGLPLGQVANRLDKLMVREVLVPAGRTKETINIKLKRVPMSEALKRLGLASRKAPRPPRDA